MNFTTLALILYYLPNYSIQFAKKRRYIQRQNVCQTDRLILNSRDSSHPENHLTTPELLYQAGTPFPDLGMSGAAYLGMSHLGALALQLTMIRFSSLYRFI